MNKKTISLLAVSVVAVIIITVVTIVLLGIFYKSADKPATSQQATATADTIVENFNQKVAAGSVLSKNSFVLTSNKAQPQLYVEDTAIHKYLQVTAKNSVTIRSTTTLDQSSLKKVTQDIEQFLVQQGLPSVQGVSEPTVLLTHASSNTTCQLVTLPVPKDPTVQLRLACTDATAYKEALDTVNHLVGLWSKATTAHYDSLSQSSTTKGDTTITILSALPADMSSSHTLIYVKTADTWTYIGDASEGEPLVPNDKYIINSDIKAALDNPTYGDFLHSILF